MRIAKAACAAGLACLAAFPLGRDERAPDVSAARALTIGPRALEDQSKNGKAPLRPAFRRLVLSGEPMIWKTSASHEGVTTLTYALLTKDRATKDAINCRDMTKPSHAVAAAGISDEVLRRELKAAFGLWSRAAAIDFVETTDEAAADILIGAEATPNGHAFTNVTPISSGKGGIAKALICLSPGSSWKVGFDGNLDIYDVRYTLAHEIGHAIGLDHPSREGHLMSYRYVETRNGLSEGDRAGAIALYGARKN